MIFTFDYEVELEDETFDVEVTYKGTRPIPETYYQPAEGGEVYLISIKRDGKEVELPPEIEDKIYDECHNRLLDDLEEDRDSYGDYKYEEKRDREMDW